MNVIKAFRDKSGFTQSDLAEKCGLSLRTIQRLEKNSKPPKGYSLNALAEVFDLAPSQLVSEYDIKLPQSNDYKTRLTIINLASFGFFIFPFGNIFLPLFLWRCKPSSSFVNEIARKIVNFQLIWSLSLSFALCIAPFLPLNSLFGVPLLFVFLFVAIIFNYFIVLKIAKKIREDDFDFLNLRIRFL